MSLNFIGKFKFGSYIAKKMSFTPLFPLNWWTKYILTTWILALSPITIPTKMRMTIKKYPETNRTPFSFPKLLISRMFKEHYINLTIVIVQWALKSSFTALFNFVIFVIDFVYWRSIKHYTWQVQNWYKKHHFERGTLQKKSFL